MTEQTAFAVGQIWRTRQGHLLMIIETPRQHDKMMFAINKRGHIKRYHPNGDAVREIYAMTRPCVKDLAVLIGMADEVLEGVPFRKYIQALV